MLKNFAVAMRRCNSAMKHLYDIHLNIAKAFRNVVTTSGCQNFLEVSPPVRLILVCSSASFWTNFAGFSA